MNTTQRKPRFKRDQNTSLRLTERDQKIIHAVYQHRFLSSEHVSILLGGSRQGILRRLSLLFHAGYLDRPKIQLVRLGNWPMVYGLGNKGAELVATELGLPLPSVDWTSKNREVRSIFLEHTLMVADFMILVRLACMKNKKVEFIGPEEIIDRRKIPPKANEKDLSWKVEKKNNGKTFSLSMVPDNAFGLRFEDGRAAYFFLEADRSTMPVRRSNLFRSSFYKKMVGYWQSWQEGVFSQYFSFKNPRVLTVTTSAERINSMIQTNKELDGRGTGLRMFLFAARKNLPLSDPEKVFEKVWTNGRGEQASILE